MTAPTPTTQSTTRMSVARRVAGATLLIMLAYGLAKMAGFVRDIVVARAFGTGWEYDAYRAAFEVPEQIFVLVSAGALSTAFIPVFSDFLQKDDDEEANRLASAILTLAFIISIALAVFVALFAHPLVAQTVGRGFDPERRALTAELMRVLLFSFVLFGVGGVFQGILNAKQHFFVPAVAPALYNVGIILGAVFLAPRWGIQGLAWGVVVGASMYFVAQLPMLLRGGLRYRPTLGLRDPAVHQVIKLMIPRVISLALFELNTLLNAILASSLVVGSISALGYGWSIMQLPETLFATALATAVFPTLAEMANRNQIAALRSTMVGTLRTIFFLTIPSAVGLIVLATPLIQTIFERGAFDANSTALVVWALRFWCLGLVAHASLEIVARTFYAMKDTVTPFMVAGLALVTNLGLALYLRGPLGVGGLALANAIAFTAQVLILLLLLSRRIDGVDGRDLLDGLLRMGASALVMAGALLLVLNGLAGQRPVVIAAVGLAVGASVYLGMVYLLRVREAREVPRIVLSRFQRSAMVPSGD